MNRRVLCGHTKKKNEKTTTDNAMAEAFEEYDADLAALEDGACSVGLFVRACARACNARPRARCRCLRVRSLLEIRKGTKMLVCAALAARRALLGLTRAPPQTNRPSSRAKNATTCDAARRAARSPLCRCPRRFSQTRALAFVCGCCGGAENQISGGPHQTHENRASNLQSRNAGARERPTQTV